MAQSVGKLSAPVLASVWMVHAADVVGTTRRPSVQAIEDRLGSLSKKGAVITASGGGSIARITALMSDQGLRDAHVQLDPAQWPADLPADKFDMFKAGMAPLHVRALSNALNHHTALQGCGEEKDGDAWCLILEDDALFTEEVGAQLQKVIKSAPKDAQIIFLGQPTSLTPDPEKIQFENAMDKFVVFPAIDSYLIRASTAKRLAQEFLPLRFTANVHMSFTLRRMGDVPVYNTVPNIFLDGSKLGVFTSSIEANNRLLWNQPYCQLDAIVRRAKAAASAGGSASGSAAAPGAVVELSEEDKKAAEAVWEAQPFKQHPDAMVVRAEYLSMIGKAADAEALFGEAHDLYNKEGCLVNNTSAFLKQYGMVYRQLQHPLPTPLPPAPIE